MRKILLIFYEHFYEVSHSIMYYVGSDANSELPDIMLHTLDTNRLLITYRMLEH